MITKKKKPNAFQKILHYFVMLRPVTAFFARKTHRMDGFILKLTKGKHTLSEVLGWNIVQLKTIGAKTSKEYVTLLIGLFDGEKIGLIASNFGQAHHPGWYHNLKKTPECFVQIGEFVGKFIAHETNGEEYEKYWRMALSYYKGYDKYKQRAAPRHIPVMVLEPAD